MKNALEKKNQEIVQLLQRRGTLSRQLAGLERQIEAIQRQQGNLQAELSSIDQRLDACEAHLAAYDHAGQIEAQRQAAANQTGAADTEQ